MERIDIPKSLHKRIESRIEGTEFRSVSEYASFVLAETLKAEEDIGSSVRSHDDAQVGKRLKSLGYL